MIEADLEQALEAPAHAGALGDERHRLDDLGHGVLAAETGAVALAAE
jgi:hypothetical protein